MTGGALLYARLTLNRICIRAVSRPYRQQTSWHSSAIAGCLRVIITRIYRRTLGDFSPLPSVVQSPVPLITYGFQANLPGLQGMPSYKDRPPHQKLAGDLACRPGITVVAFWRDPLGYRQWNDGNTLLLAASLRLHQLTAKIRPRQGLWC